MPFSSHTTPASRSSSEVADFERLFNENWDPVFRVLYRLLGDQDEAEDIALETFVQLHRNTPARMDNPGGWLYRVATHLGLNALRARKRRMDYERQAGMHALEISSSDNPEKAAERKSEQENVRNALLKLKPRSAQILLLRYSGVSYAEIAAALKINPTSVGTLLSRAEKEFSSVYQE